jgi:hypothetical protein
VIVVVGIPFVFDQAVVVFGINDGEFLARQRNLSEGIAEADAAVNKKKRSKLFFKDFCDIEDNLVDFISPSFFSRPSIIGRMCVFGAKIRAVARRPSLVTRLYRRR